MRDAKRLIAKLHYLVTCTKPSDVRKVLQSGADPHAIYSHPNGHYSGNVFHAHASLRHIAYSAADYELVEVLKESGADLNAPNSRGERPLHVAARVEEKESAGATCLVDLLAHGANPNHADVNGRTPLYYICGDATTEQHVLMQCAAALVNAGARVDAPDMDGVTPLMKAAQAGYAEIYSYLVLKGADVHAKDRFGRMASRYALEGGNYVLHDLIRTKEETLPLRPGPPGSVTANVSWKKLSDHRIARVTVEEPIDYRITEVFNFRARNYMCITQNLFTKAEAVTVKSFEDFGDAQLLEDAHIILERKGGKAEFDRMSGTKRAARIKFPK